MFLLEKGTLDHNGCLIWYSKGDKDGYGTTTLSENGIRKTWKVHRLIWSLTKGEIPKGMLICHKCDNPRCFNLDHLFLGTHSDNSMDREKKQRSGNNYENGSKNPQSKLTEQDVLLIRELYSTGNSALEISKKFNIHPNHVTRLNSKGRWKHI